MCKVFVPIAILCAGICCAQAPRDLDPRQNLALGKKVTFLPTTRSNEADARAALTDGKLAKGVDRKSWFGKTAVRWFTSGRTNLCVDLGEV